MDNNNIMYSALRAPEKGIGVKQTRQNTLVQQESGVWRSLRENLLRNGHTQ